MANHIKYEERLAFVRKLLAAEFRLKAEDTVIEPVAYEEDCPFPYNNFIFRITSSGGFRACGQSSDRPGCHPIPTATRCAILRLSNAEAMGVAQHNRVENEVAVINLVREALEHIKPQVVPAVYAWGSAAGAKQGWIMQEMMPGSPLDAEVDGLNAEQKRSVFAQMAAILAAIQNHPLPRSITANGGLTYDAKGDIISAPLTNVGAGPWSSYEEYFKAQLDLALTTSEQNLHIKGWHQNDVRKRLEAFIETGLASQFAGLGSRDDKCVVHADFTPNNILYDKNSMLITGLLDYDFSGILHPSYEFLRSFNGNGGQLVGYSGNETGDEWALRNAKLQGFPDPLPSANPDDGVDWEASKIWEEELARAHAKRPSTIAHIEKVADVDALVQMITPWRLTNEQMLARQSESAIAKYRAQTEASLIKMLNRLGF